MDLNPIDQSTQVVRNCRFSASAKEKMPIHTFYNIFRSLLIFLERIGAKWRRTGNSLTTNPAGLLAEKMTRVGAKSDVCRCPVAQCNISVFELPLIRSSSWFALYILC